ncbi:MAG TPA: DEAD/DEAH box helicase [Micromonosporaceae bacterium]|nr:DEAD/DEAH box helicase [Micromonosporaceae bacterium]
MDGALLTRYASLLSRLRTGAVVARRTSDLVDQAASVWSRPGFDVLLSRAALRFEPFDYQVEAAQTVLRRMRGRAILADEVGLGKTIEAGLVLAELRLRGLAGRTLVVTPAGLVEQWREELERKFGLPTAIASRDGWDAGLDRPVVLASLAAARRDPLRSLLVGREWDAVVIDEAHRVRAPRSASGRLARELRARYLLLLTATPVENRLADLYEMVSLVAPGLLGTAAQFRAQHGSGTADPAVQAPKNAAALRARTREVMIRHRRSEVALMLPPRLAETLLVAPAADEAELYADVTARVRNAGRTAPAATRLALRSLVRLAGSTPAAAAATLTKLGWTDLATRAAAVSRPHKTAVLLERLRAHAERGEKVLVFTGFRATLDHLARLAAEAGIPAAVYHGSLPRAGKEAAIGAFRDEVPVLLSTESAGEGRNLQFCHVMVNVDLPWNPMQIEQRLGRLHRVGQRHEVLIANLVARGTIEERVLRVLEAKINLFELVVGELDLILGRVEEDFDLESAIFNAYLGSDDDTQFAQRLDAIGDDLARARRDYLHSRGTLDALVGDEETAGVGA